MKRNSFIEMAKLHNLSGRITYISSRARQEHLYEVYATESDRVFWRELAKCSQEEFEKSGTNGKCIEARELMVALPESFINYDHDYLLKKMVDEFKEKYGMECFAALHHNKRKTRLVPVEKGQTAEKLPQPKPSALARKYPRLKEIEGRLKDQNKAIFGREKERDMLKKELSECTGIFKGGRRKELQQEIDSLDFQISNMKKRLSSIVKEYNFDSVQAFYKERNAAKKENHDYEAACAEYEKTYGEKVVDTRSVRNGLRQSEHIIIIIHLVDGSVI